MKKLFGVITFAILLSLSVKADPTIAGELSFRILNNTSGDLITVEYELVSEAAWDARKFDPTHNITTLYNSGSLNTNSISTDWLEFWAIWESEPEWVDFTFALGYYSFKVKVNGTVVDSFFIDYRTSDLPEDFNGGGSTGDILVDFNVNDNKLYYNSSTTEFPTFTSVWADQPWIGTSTSGLPNFWENALVMVDDGSGHPYLVWGEYTSTVGIAHYNVYKKIGSGAFTFYAQVPANTPQYTDMNETILYGPPQANETEVFYRVAAAEPTTGKGFTISDYTNTVDARIQGAPQTKTDLSDIDVQAETPSEFTLFQNYPNPFNPVTDIKYELSRDAYVSLKVYDVLGREMSSLVSEFKKSGVHIVRFDASSLNSGIYIYQLQVDNFRTNRQLLLLK